MKKVTIILLLLISGLSNVSATSWYTLTSLNAKNVGGEWQGWEPCRVETSFNFDTKRIEIYSDTPQIFDYVNIERVQYTGYITLSGYVSDRFYKTAYMIVTIYDNGYVFLHFQYSYGEYMYAIQ